MQGTCRNDSKWLVFMSMDVAGRGNVGNSATYLYFNERLVHLAKVAIIVHGQITCF